MPPPFPAPFPPPAIAPPAAPPAAPTTAPIAPSLTTSIVLSFEPVSLAAYLLHALIALWLGAARTHLTTRPGRRPNDAFVLSPQPSPSTQVKFLTSPSIPQKVRPLKPNRAISESPSIHT